MAVVNRTVPRTPPKAAAQQKASKPLRVGPVLLVALGALIAIGLLQIVQTSQATTASFRIRALEQTKLGLETEVGQLEAEVAALSALERIEREAGRLGLELPAARSSVDVSVAWSAADDPLLPTRFAPGEQDEAVVDGQADESSWWRNLLKPFPF